MVVNGKWSAHCDAEQGQGADGGAPRFLPPEGSPWHRRRAAAHFFSPF